MSLLNQIQRDQGQPSLELQLRYLVEVLHAPNSLHTNPLVQDGERAYGALCYANTRVERDGSVALLPRSAPRADPPGAFLAPEVLAGGMPDPQADIYAAGMMLLPVLPGPAWHRAAR